MRNVRSYWLWNTFPPYSSVTKSRDQTDQDPSEPSPSTSPSPPSSQTVARALSRASNPRFFFPWCGTHREHVRIKKNLEWLSNAASSKAKLASCQQGEERRGRTNDVCRVPCSVPASSPSTSALPSATDVRRPHRQLRSDNELCPVCVSASLCVGRRVQCQSLSNYSPAVGGHALYTHDAVVIHSPLQSTACGCSPQPAPEPATGQTGDGGKGRGKPTSPVGSESDPASVGEVGAHEGHQGLCPPFLAAWIAPLSP